jgi:hypothetical protein
VSELFSNVYDEGEESDLVAMLATISQDEDVAGLEAPL